MSVRQTLQELQIGGTTKLIVETGSMRIVCPHCTTSYAIDLATLGAAGRTVRCSRCKEVWLARKEDAVEAGAPVAAMAEAGGPGDGGEWTAGANEDNGSLNEIPA